MRRARPVTAALMATCALLAGATAAHAATREISGPVPNTFLNPDVTIDRGEQLSYLNLDPISAHNVTSVKHRRRTGRPIFSSATIGVLRQTPVNGTAALRPGSYGFLCTLHVFMTGTLTVR
jgi:plastocyanin